MPWQSHRPVYRDGRTFSAVNTWVFFSFTKRKWGIWLHRTWVCLILQKIGSKTDLWMKETCALLNQLSGKTDMLSHQIKLKIRLDPQRQKSPHAHQPTVNIWCTDTFLIHQIGLFSPLCWPSIPSGVKQPLGVTHVRTCVGLRWGGGLCWELTG